MNVRRIALGSGIRNERHAAGGRSAGERRDQRVFENRRSKRRTNQGLGTGQVGGLDSRDGRNVFRYCRSARRAKRNGQRQANAQALYDNEGS